MVRGRARFVVGRWLTHISLTTGAVYGAVVLLGACALAFLVSGDRRSIRWWTAPAAVGAATAVVTVGSYLLDDVIRPWPERLPFPVLVWSEIAMLGLTLAVLRIIAGGGWRRRTAWAAAGLLALLWGVADINRDYGYLPTLGALIGVRPDNTVALPVTRSKALLAEPPAGYRSGRVLEENWRPPADMPKLGSIVPDTPIPGVLSGFPARPAWIYLPPAYLVATPPPLPVLVLIAGQPGTPRNWIDGGHLVATMDGFAEHHHGLAPIVVLPDVLGGTLSNPLCLDSRLGQAETYLSRDVPLWVRQTLAVNPDPAAWAIGGFSFGGTCSLQMAVRAPDVFRTFLDISGQLEPTLGSRARTVDAAFGGNEAAFRQVNPLDVMSRQKFPDTTGYFAAGAQDPASNAHLRQLAAAAVRCGMHTAWVDVEGTHSWTVAADALRQALPLIAGRMSLVAP